MRVDEKVVVISGAAGAIGSVIAGAFLEEGSLVALIDIDGPGLRRVAAALQQEG